VPTTATAVLTAIPDRRRRLADGVLVDARIRARLLGIRLLTLDATVVLVPADVAPAAASARYPPRRASVGSSSVPATRPARPGRGLAEALRRIDEGAELLAQTRRNGF
jgi:pyridoxal biosynthesis lyase PdxS